MIWLAATPVAMLLFWWGKREWGLWREFHAASKSNSSRTIVKDHKKSPPQAEAGTGVEYGGTHLP